MSCLWSEFRGGNMRNESLIGPLSADGWRRISPLRMEHVSLVVGLLAACTVTAASAQPINLTGTYRCIQMCRAGNFGFPTYVTQNGDAVNLVTETGESYRACPQCF